MKVSIIGSKGRIGSTIREKIAGGGHTILLEADRNEPISTVKLHDSDLVILAVPQDEAISLIGKYGEECTMVELTSVKSPMEKFSGKVISIHPLFGPASWENPDFNTVLFVNDISPEGSMEKIQQLFPGHNVVSVTAKEHDMSMADLLVAPYAISMIAKRIVSRQQKFVTPSFVNLQKIAAILDGENSSVVRDTMSRNEFTNMLLEQIGNEIMELRSGLN